MEKVITGQLASEHVPESCGCKVIDGTIEFCAFHAAAPKLLNELIELHSQETANDEYIRDVLHKTPEKCNTCRLIARAQGKS